MILSPAKSSRWEKVTARVTPTLPPFLTESDLVARALKSKTKNDLKKIMGISDSLAALNFERNQSYLLSKEAKKKSYGDPELNMAVFAFDGPAYKGLDAESLNAEEMQYLQENLKILCGLYGVLRPCDLMQQYRLEMGTKMNCGQSKDLYSYWTETITPYLSDQICNNQDEKVIVNLASQEYAKSVNLKRLEEEGVTVVNCIFKDSGRVLSVFAKRARGLMARWCAQQRPASVAALQGFDLEGYRFAAGQSTPTDLVFARDKPAPSSKTPRAKTSTKTKKGGMVKKQQHHTKEIKKETNDDDNTIPPTKNTTNKPRSSKKRNNSNDDKNTTKTEEDIAAGDFTKREEKGEEANHILSSKRRRTAGRR